MAESTPLLEDEDEGNYVENRKTRRPLINLGGLVRDGDRATSLIDDRQRAFPSDIPDVVCVFVVAFDTRAGNIVEWCFPDDADLDGIEFKAMASGSHKIASDFIYFKKGSLYGLACFENMPVESEIERRARMKSVGVLASSYSHLHRYMAFLECQVSVVLQKPGRYDRLRQFYEENKGVLGATADPNEVRVEIGSPSTDMRITHPAGCFSQFVRFFGEQVFTLWKFVLLQKRILFFSPPPIGVVCYRVFCVSCLGNHTMRDIPVIAPKPLFYVSVADIDMLETETNYIACTTEKIFESKPRLYDVYVDNQNLTTDIPVLNKLLSPTSADKEKFAKLCHREREMKLFEPGVNGDDEESLFISYFTDLNNQLFSMLLEVSYTQDKQLASNLVSSIGLDPVGDRQFLMELVESYGMDVVLMVDNPCCPK